MVWNLYNQEKFLAPLKFSNGKTQEDIVNEVINSIKEGNKIIFIKGVCGTGKSAIALNIAKELGKSSIVVPGKNLQRQYKKDYENNKYLLKSNGKKLKISIITGRKNHVCKFLEDSKKIIPKSEINSKLNDIFESKRNEVKQIVGRDLSADNRNIPCKIEINEKNWNRIKEYLKENKGANHLVYRDINEIKRSVVASACPYWCPVLSEKYEFKQFQNAKKKKYLGLNNTKFIFYERKSGCKFYEQFNSYVESDVIVFNSHKYKLETALNRKPYTEVEIIDECDEFLDSFSNNRTINLDRLQNSLNNISKIDEKSYEIVQEIIEIIKKIKKDEKIRSALSSGEILTLKESGIDNLLKLFLKNSEFLYQIDEENYLFDVEETAWVFDGFFDETHVIFERKDSNIYANLVTTNLAKRFKDIVNKNKNFVLMSGTIHSEEVLKEVFGLEDFKIIEAEIEHPGKIDIIKTGLEINCKYSNFFTGKSTRENYLKALNKCLEVSKKPTLIHINSFSDLPKEKEIEDYKLKNLISREGLKEMQDKDKEGKLIEDFKKRKIDVLFSTKTARGIDFPGEECNSIIFTKYPNADVKEAFWKILKKTKPQYYWKFYKDKSQRELLQKVYRGLRFKEDHIFILSPDLRVLDYFNKIE